jgi:transcriptional accessory protein Tex/SPT6
VDLGGDVEGFVPISQLGYRNLENPADKFREGDLLVLKVIESDPDSRRIVLSVIDIPSHRERGEEDVVVAEQPAEPTEETPEPRREPSTQMADAMAEAQIEVGAGTKSNEAAEEAADRESVE